VARYRLSRRAEADSDNIIDYTLRTWGEAQTDRYVYKLEECCRLLANSPRLGRECDEISPGLRRMEQGKHVVFYREEFRGILVCRILHQRMLPEGQNIDDDDDALDSA
jgi:toxin ParE1/3/4